METQNEGSQDPFEGTSAQTELKRAYLLVEFEEWEHALAACDRAAERAPDHPMPMALKGSILAAAGEFKDAIKTLRRTSRAHSDHALTQLFLAEALFLDGKIPAGKRALDSARGTSDFDEHREMADLLSQTFVDTVGQNQ